MSKADELKKHLRAGKVYRRSELAKWSKSIDRHLQQLVQAGDLQKLSGGIYYCPQLTDFGTLPPDDETLVQAFLKDDQFHIASLNSYNSLGVGTTQLYNEKLVYNTRRDGRHTFNGRNFYFIKRPRFPAKSSQEFLLIDLMNNLHFLAEDKESVLCHVRKKARTMDKSILMNNVRDYAGARTQSFFEKLLQGEEQSHAV